VFFAFKTDVDGPIEGGFLEEDKLNLGIDSQRCKVAEDFWISVTDTLDLVCLTFGSLPETGNIVFRNSTVFGGNRISVRILGRETESRVYSIFEFLRNDVFQPFRLVMNSIPAVSQNFRKVKFDESVVAQHFKRYLFPRGRKSDSAVTSVF
jgi:hypothetical protein